MKVEDCMTSMWSRLFAPDIEELSDGDGSGDECATGWFSGLQNTLNIAGKADPKKSEPREGPSDGGSYGDEGAMATGWTGLLWRTLNWAGTADTKKSEPTETSLDNGTDEADGADDGCDTRRPRAIDQLRKALKSSVDRAIEVPSYWKTTDQKSLVPQLIPITPSQKSYKEIKEKLQASGVTNTIRSITRIENTALYHEYTARQARIQKDCPGTEVERILFHGTKADVIQDININGFSRSYFGSANAAAFGNGVYFAVNPAFSAQQQYSPPDGNKIKYIYQCRVLTGVFCKGQRGLKAPPQIPSLPDGVRYDSVVNDKDKPTIFVIFRDSQVYPEYLIQLVDKS